MRDTISLDDAQRRNEGERDPDSTAEASARLPPAARHRRRRVSEASARRARTEDRLSIIIQRPDPVADLADLSGEAWDAMKQVVGARFHRYHRRAEHDLGGTDSRSCASKACPRMVSCR